MDTVKNILGAAQAIYAQYERVKCCKCQSRRLVERIRILMRPIKTLQAQPTKTVSPQLEGLLQKLLRSLEKAKRLLEKYSHQNWMQKFLKASEALEEFSNVNEQLSDAAEGLSLLLQVEQVVKESFQRDVLRQENNKDFEADRVLLEEMLRNSKETRDGVDNIQCEVKQIQGKLDEVLQKLDARPRTSTADVETIEIEKRLLTKWTLLKEFESHVLYKGEYHKFPVAIKVFKNPVITSTQKVRDLFRKEIKAMKRFESPHILRMYGICIDESGPSPEFSIVTEYCEKGSLRDVLKKEPDLSWRIRIQMALHAANGLYRLHQTGDKSQLHGSINSNMFLVAEGYSVKLSGFELSQTESSLRRKHKEKKQKEISPSAYVSPQGLTSVNHIYDLPSEIYSFGIVLWEIATGKTPFRGCTSQEIHQKVYKEGYQEPLGEDCPAGLREVIHQCRNYEPSKRPSAEGIVDSLRSISSVTTVTL
ncbi:PREDICTED: mixed lineage kinase domain-like protein isoform X1 [Gekko japonicus]|uniref:Mixed lineage kinase domain-like protein isoform X1 n=1 Tax=Gekko japonicus TaxID=146911 RepID=A0ABM1LGW7_GEKJA|nr:PREDICTED: mixed lineage kinase domain-like protein isoform X1 [Gekko japonicus]